MTKAAAMISRGLQHEAEPQSSCLLQRPGWVVELVVAVLASSDQPLRPQDVVQQAERRLGRRLGPSSVHDALCVASQRHDGPMERVGYGTYQLRRHSRKP
jgi:hypothetical protein